MTGAGQSTAVPPGLAYRMALARSFASDNNADGTENDGTENDGSENDDNDNDNDFSPNDDEEVDPTWK